MIKLQDFAAQQHVTDRQIQRLLKKYEKELDGLYQRQGPNGTWLTDEACEILRSKMKKSAIAVYEPDPAVARLEAELEEAKQLAKEYWAQLKQKENTVSRLVEQNDEYRLQASSVRALEAELTDRIKTASQEAAEAAKQAADEHWVLEVENVRKAAQKAREDADYLHQQELAARDEKIRELESRNLWHYLTAPFRKKGKE